MGVAAMAKVMVNWDAALRVLTHHLPAVERSVRAFTLTNPKWYVRAGVESYPPRITLCCLLRVRGKTRRVTTGVEIGSFSQPNTAQAFTPTDDELREIGDFIGGLETTEFKPRRIHDTKLPWVNYELRPDFSKYELR